MVQWLRLLLPMQGAQVQSLVGELRPTCLVAKNQNLKQKQYCNTFNKDFKNGLHQKKSLGKKRRNTASADMSFLISLLYMCSQKEKATEKRPI